MALRLVSAFRSNNAPYPCLRSDSNRRRRITAFGYDAPLSENRIFFNTTHHATFRITQKADLRGILNITNWAIRETASNFNDQPYTLNRLIETWTQTHDYPWLVAEDYSGSSGICTRIALQGAGSLSLDG